MVNCQDIMVIFILSLADFFRTDADFRNSELKRAIYTSSSGIGSIGRCQNKYKTGGNSLTVYPLPPTYSNVAVDLLCVQ